MGLNETDGLRLYTVEINLQEILHSYNLVMGQCYNVGVELTVRQVKRMFTLM